MNHKCLNCGKKILRSPGQIKSGHGKYCSKECSVEYRIKRSIGSGNPAWRGGKSKCICKTCGKEFKVNPSRIKRGQGKYCSSKCRHIGVAKTNHKLRGRNNCSCPVCGTGFHRKPSYIRKLLHTYCSLKCYSINKEGENLGDNNPNWKGGIKPVASILRATDQYEKWRHAVFIRDNFKCRVCKEGGRIHAHHIKRMSILRKEAQKYFPLFGELEACKLYPPLWDTNNGITLCIKCHSTMHNGVFSWEI